MKKLALHWKIIIGMFLGFLVGFLANFMGVNSIIIDWIQPFGKIFINLLKLLAVPLIFASLIKGISGVKDISSLSKMGYKTVGVYLFTTVIAIIIALILSNVLAPGHSLPADVHQDMIEEYGPKADSKTLDTEKLKQGGPLRFIVEIVPDNIVNAMQDNGKMLKVIFFTILFGITLVLLPEDKTKTIRQFFDDLNEVILKMVDIIMAFAPYGVFALLAGLVSEKGEKIFGLFQGLGAYALTVVTALAFMVFIVYPLILRVFTKRPYTEFFKGIAPAQMLAFSTSSSAATLPLTMECCEDNLKIPNSVASFVLPLGATVNMDGTSIWHTVTTIFLAQVYGYDLTLAQQLTIILTATLSSIGAVGVPGGGIVMLIIVLQSVGLPSEGIAIIMGIDRLLDMCRTVVNVTGDSAVATVVADTQN